MFGPILPWLSPLLESFAASTSALLGDQENAGRHLAAAVEFTSRVEPSPLLATLLDIARNTVAVEFQLSDLTPAERRVFAQLRTRATLREIANSLFVSPETIKTQTGSIYRKLGVANRRELQELADRLRIPLAPL